MMLSAKIYQKNTFKLNMVINVALCSWNFGMHSWELRPTLQYV